MLASAIAGAGHAALRIDDVERHGYARPHGSNALRERLQPSSGGTAVKRSPIVLLGLVLVCLPLTAAEQPAHLLAADLYAQGKYSDCRGLVNRLIDDYAAGVIEVPARDMAPVYLLAACLAEIYRDTYWSEAVDDNLRIALEMDPNVDPTVTESRAFVKNRLSTISAELIASQGPSGRRFSMGLVLGVDGPGSIHWRNTPSLGLRLGAGITSWLTVEGGVQLPLRDLPSDGAELYLGGTFRPEFGLNRPMVVLNASYVATHEAAWTHGLSCSAGAEIAFRTGISLRVAIEMLRLEGTVPPDPLPTDYPSIVLFGMPVTFSLPRMSLTVAYAF